MTYVAVDELALAGLLNDAAVEELEHRLVGDDELVELLHVGLFGARQRVVGQVLQDLGDEDQLSLRHLVGRIVEQAIGLRRQQGRADKPKEVERADGPELGRVAEPLPHLHATDAISPDRRRPGTIVACGKHTSSWTCSMIMRSWRGMFFWLAVMSLNIFWAISHSSSVLIVTSDASSSFCIVRGTATHHQPPVFGGRGQRQKIGPCAGTYLGVQFHAGHAENVHRDGRVGRFLVVSVESVLADPRPLRLEPLLIRTRSLFCRQHRMSRGLLMCGRAAWRARETCLTQSRGNSRWRCR